MITLEKLPLNLWSIKYNVSVEILTSQYLSICDHIQLVHNYGTKFGVEKRLLEIHDLSKFGKHEFPFYAKKFHGLDENNEFKKAVNHHYANNPHHPQFWKRNGIIEIMPNKYILEMVADWHAASQQYSGKDSIQDWLDKNYKSIEIHARSRIYLDHILKDLGYDL